MKLQRAPGVYTSWLNFVLHHVREIHIVANLGSNGHEDFDCMFYTYPETRRYFIYTNAWSENIHHITA